MSGGQTGADRGGLDAAIVLGIAHGGWCPRGRRSEDGKVPGRYVLTETGSASYQNRTRRNVIDADGTVIFTRGRLEGGSLLTARVARETGKPCLHIDLKQIGAAPAATAERFRSRLAEHRVEILNVAGSRESKARGIQRAVSKFLVFALSAVTATPRYAVEKERIFSDAAADMSAESPAPYASRRSGDSRNREAGKGKGK